METIAIIQLVDLALAVLEKTAPALKQAFERGEISVEQQKKLADRIAAFKAGGYFNGPEWEIK